ncbi:zinc-dependent metalloprotease [uncultured Nocardioides sp.]|uniref:zinc-dependent metalloprotease n=1 Tax=uncultured Nocardioides sp. TaxID=198441 RepID=UPI003456D751
MSNMVDWDFAVTLGAKVAGDGPDIAPDAAAAAVTELREGAERSSPLVREFTGLVAAERTAPVLVVDRRGWVQANADGFATIIGPLADKLAGRKGPPSGLALAIGSRVTGAEVGLLLGFLGTKVLGQFDPFFDPTGRLLLVAPNIVHVERELDVDPHDFRLWVCLHEETHRVQFTAVPWMRDHLFSEMSALLDSFEPSDMLGDGLRRASEAIRGGVAGGGSVVEMMSTPEQRAIMDRVTGVMSLLEGHADVVMDGVGPSVIPTVEQIRAKFTKRRQGLGSLDRILRRLLGLDAKMAQYRDGAIFVRAVVDKVGMEQFNAVWAGPGNLPSTAEIKDPDAWVARVL